MKIQRKFQVEPLTDMISVGAVDANSARIWMRAAKTGDFVIRWWPEKEKNAVEGYSFNIPEKNDRDNTWSIRIPGDSSHSRLEPLQRYQFRITHADKEYVIGDGSFETFPEKAEKTPARFSIALISCNQPFEKDGSLGDDDEKMLIAAYKCLKKHNTKYLLMVGDQMYSDYPRKLSLFNQDYFSTIAPAGKNSILECSVEEIRRIFQLRYRYFRNLPGWRNIHKEIPVFAIMDDHDIVDNWGSDPSHQNPEWQILGKGALWAYYDYQGSYILPPKDDLPESFHYSFEYGFTATFVMDLRSERRAGDNGQLFSSKQKNDLIRFLADNEDKKMIFIVLSVPVIHISRRFAKIMAKVTPNGEDFSDRWSSGKQIEDRDRFFRIIHDHQEKNPDQKVFFLSGDIHVGCAHKISWADGVPPLYQLISSAITHKNGPLVQVGAKLLVHLNKEIATEDSQISAKIHPLKGERGYNKNPYAKLNIGILEIESPENRIQPTLRFRLYGHKGYEPVCVYQSPLL
ncbi:MAG: alkaline phosphatase D family protein [Desulfobacterales bacterium]